MTLNVLFWVLMIVWLVFGFWLDYVPGQPYPFRRGAWTFLVWILLAIIGWQVFGPAVHRASLLLTPSA